ncbi:MAG: 50S ribosomal protein L7/L12 [Solobacterium sp.]|nr:50S ribosomal protein L7/L12 [Solobacterium sp.]
MAKLTKDEILAFLDEATILELNDLVKAIEEKYGVSAAAPVAVAAAPAEAAADEPKNVTVVLTSVGDAKVGVIKVVRTITGLGLVEAKKLVDALPAEIKKDVPVEEADGIKKQLLDAGATVEYK